MLQSGINEDEKRAEDLEAQLYIFYQAFSLTDSNVHIPTSVSPSVLPRHRTPPA